MDIGSALEDLLLRCLDEALADAGCYKLLSQPCTEALIARAIEALRDDDASFQEAARIAVRTCARSLVKYERHIDHCDCEVCWWERGDRDYHRAVDAEIVGRGVA